MSSKDKTREKLMGSMRKTKADAGISRNGKAEPAASPSAAPKSAKPAAEKGSSARQKSPPLTISTDSYQSGRRVWPD